MTLQYIAIIISAGVTLFLIFRIDHWKRKYEEIKDDCHLHDMQKWRARYFQLEAKSLASLSDDEFDNPSLGDG